MESKIYIKWLLPDTVVSLLRSMRDITKLVPNVIYDNYRYLVYSGMNRSRNYKGEHEARIIMAYHQIEKGLSLSHPRPGFGRSAINRLLRELKPFIEKYGLVSPATHSIASLNAYIKFNENAGLDMSSLQKQLDELLSNQQDIPCCKVGGVKGVTSEQIELARKSSFDAFFESRYSVRDFTGLPIKESELKKAVMLSQKTPSVCNRQAWKVHAYTDKTTIQELLAVQNGSRGFGDQSSVLLLITCDLTKFVNIDERYQAWIDGGMFSMSLCLSLHYYGYGTCCLNWSKQLYDDIKLRKISHIKPHEQVIMMMAVGTLPDKFKVALSARSSIDDVLSVY